MNEFATTREPFARYYVRHLIAKEGYKLGVVPEAEELLRHCDYVLTKSRGTTISTIGIVNCESSPDKMFTMSPKDLEGIAKAIRQSAAGAGKKVRRSKIAIHEIGPGAIGKASKSRLSACRRRGIGKGYSISVMAVDTTARRTWPKPLFGRRFSRAGQIERILRAPRLSAADLSDPMLAIRFGRPIFTFVLLALLAAIFCCEEFLTRGQSGGLAAPSIETLQTLGGLSYPLVVGAGQWWRVFTAPLLHADLSHIGFNGFALFLIGRLLEPLVGWRWTAATFAVSALCGSFMSLAVNPVNIIGIGASGGIVGLFAAALTVSFRIPQGIMRTRLISQAVYGLVPALLPFLNAATNGGKIDYGAHFGGAIGGVGMGLVLLAIWPGRLPRPRWANFGALIAIVFFACAACSLVPIRDQIQQQALLAPDLPVSADESGARLAQLMHDYPHDPRLRFLDAQSLLRHNNISGAEADLRAALAEQTLLKDGVAPDLENRIRVSLAAVLRSEGRRDEAKTVVKPACMMEKNGPIADYMKKFSLCL